MTIQDSLTIRPATPDDADVLARLIDIAGEGIPAWYWAQSAEPGQSVLEVGAERARRETGGFSYRNALVAERPDRNGRLRVVGMVLGYGVEAPSDEERAGVADLPAPIRPMIELEQDEACIGTFYVNAIAVLAGLRGQGIGTRLLAAAEARAKEAGAEAMSIQVFSQNQGATRLYERAGYKEVTRRGILEHPAQPYYDEDIVLLVKPVDGVPC